MQPEGSLSCSQQPATGLYFESDKSNPHRQTLFPRRSISILSSHLRLGLPSGLFLSGFTTKILYAFLVVVVVVYLTTLFQQLRLYSVDF
jgi:hypothetical protein